MGVGELYEAIVKDPIKCTYISHVGHHVESGERSFGGVLEDGVAAQAISCGYEEAKIIVAAGEFS